MVLGPIPDGFRDVPDMPIEHVGQADDVVQLRVGRRGKEFGGVTP